MTRDKLNLGSNSYNDREGYNSGAQPSSEEQSEYSYDLAGFIGRTVVEHFWCPYCGGWHGSEPPPKSQSARPSFASPVPETMGKIVRKVVESDNRMRPEGRARWKYGGYVDGLPAKVRQDGEKIDALWGGGQKPDSHGHGHIVSHDGLNANFVAEPGADGRLRDTPVDDRRADPYQQDSPLGFQYDEGSNGYNFT